mmetsp:Transcript_15407/g.18685  ORF Transcript_15407/g.18685 Transcript_15407/m.18685 type:complete len:91 (-) Transcript_15407:871-1143(-)
MQLVLPRFALGCIPQARDREMCMLPTTMAIQMVLGSAYSLLLFILQFLGIHNSRILSRSFGYFNNNSPKSAMLFGLDCHHCSIRWFFMYM